MSYSKCASAALSPVHPPLGTLIDGHSLELVEVLGVGGYGIVYRAVDRDPLSLTGHLKSYAVKCLVSSPNASPRQRHVHIREIALHQLASVHPGVVTLHRVIEHQNVTYIILDYAPDHDLFTQILRNCRYLGNDDLIKHVFLQLLDAVEYCHLLGIYHRDLKPENVLCFDGGIRVAITDFGLATTEKMSDEFRTGSVYHMSPECQGGEFAPDGYYSPQANDVWSLGIVLLNLATGRNPWKSAMASDPTFQAYLRNPRAFLPSVLPISYAANELLMRMLDVNWHTRMTLPEVRRAIKAVDTFYCDGVIFEGSMARCPWEAGMDLDSEEDEIINDADELVVNEWRKRAGVYSVDESSSSSSSGSEDYGEQDSSAIPESLAGIPPQSTKSALAPVTEASRWSADSATSQIVFANRSPMSSMGAPWTDFTSSKATWGCESNISPTSPTGQSTYGYSTDVEFQFDAVDSDNHRFLSIEETEYNHSTFQHDVSLPKKRPGLKLNTHLDALEEYTGSSLDGTSMASLSSASSDTMQTANDYEDDSSSSIYFLADSSAIHSSKSPRISITVPLSNASSTYEDPLSFMHTSDHIAQLLTPSKDTLMTSPLATNADWHVKPLTRASFSGEDTPSRYSVSSAAISPLLSQMLSEEDHDKDKLSSMASRASSWNTVFGAASMRTGGMKSPYNTFCRSTAPSPEESVLKMTLQGSTDGIEVTEPEQLACESQPTFNVDDPAKLTSTGDMCLPSPRSPTDSPSPSVPRGRFEPQRFVDGESPGSEERQRDSRTPARAKSARSVALFNALRLLSRPGSPTVQTPPRRPHTSDSRTPTKAVGSTSQIQENLSSDQASKSREHSPVRRLLSTKRSPVRAGSTPIPQPRNAGHQLISRLHPRRATIHIGSMFRQPSEESALVFASFSSTTETSSSSADTSPLSTPGSTAASSSSSLSTSPPTTPSRAASPTRITSPEILDPLASPSSDSSQLPILPVKTSSPPAPARTRRWTVSGWTKVRSSEVQDSTPVRAAFKPFQTLHQVPAVDRSSVGRKQGNEGRLPLRQGGNKRRRGWLPKMLGGGTGFPGIDLQKVAKIPIEASKWLGSLSGGSSKSGRSKSGNVNGGAV